MDAALAYLTNLQQLLQTIAQTQPPQIEAAAEAFAQTIARGRPVFLFGTGHSHMLCEELFYRAGGLVLIQPMLETSLMLHESASKSTALERVSAYAEVLFRHFGLTKGDVLCVISNSGRNGLPVDLALLAKQRGLRVIALTSVRHSQSALSRHPSGKRLFEIADIVLDNGGCPGDASVYIEGLGRNAAPTSTAAGAAILNAVAARCVELLCERGCTPEVFASSNIDGGDRINEAYLQKYKNQLRFL